MVCNKLLTLLLIIFPILTVYPVSREHQLYWHIDYKEYWGATTQSTEIKDRELNIKLIYDYNQEGIDLKNKILYIYSGRLTT